jgi:hypothetical protein
MDKKPSFLWALAVGLLFPVLNAVGFLFRFGSFSADAPATDYLLFFLAGSLIGLALVYLLRRSENRGVSTAVLVAFVVSIPFALFGMALGGAVGFIGIFFLGVSPSVFLIAVGYFLGRMLAKK